MLEGTLLRHFYLASGPQAAGSGDLLGGGAKQVAARAAFGAQTSSAAGFAGLLVILFATHFFFDSATLDQLAEPAHGLLNGLAIPDVQLNHMLSFFG